MSKRTSRGSLESLGEKLGVLPHIRAFSRMYADKKLYIGYKFAANPQTIEFEGIEAKFVVSTLAQYKMVHSEKEELRRILDELEPGDTYWDIGANIGTHTVIPAHSLAGVNVVAFEPFPENIKSLKRNVAINGVENVVVNDVAFGDKEGEVDLNIEGGSPGTSGHSIVTDRGDEWISVPITRGDALLERQDPPDVIKIDVQAAELSVLKGMSEALNASCRAVFCEVHRSRGVVLEDVRELLADHDFHVEIMSDSGSSAQLVATK